MAGPDPVITDFENSQVSTALSGIQTITLTNPNGLSGWLWIPAPGANAVTVGALSMTSDAHGGASALNFSITGISKANRAGGINLMIDRPMGAQSCSDFGLHSGIEFWAKGNAPGGAFLNIYQEPFGASFADDFFVAFVPTSTWTKYSIPWTSLADANGSVFNPFAVDYAEFSIGAAAVDQSLTLDDIAFFGPPCQP